MEEAKDGFYLAASADAAHDVPGTKQVAHTEWSGASRPAAAQRLGTAFTAVTGGGSTNAYNLMEGMGLTDYSYPKLQGIPHYGDWKAEFESGSLAYYEHYQNGTAAGYGFLGGNVSSLRDDETVLGDGYGMIYDSKPTASVTVTYWTWTATGVAVQKTEMLAADAADAAVQVTYNGRSYYLLPLPTGAVNTEYVDPNSFYQEVRVDGAAYLYAPHFARTVTTPGEDGTVESPTGVSIRTARQLYALSLYRKFAPQRFELKGLTLTMGLEPFDTSKVAALCEKLGVEYIVRPTEIGRIIFEERHEKNPCSLCAKMRRGALNDLAKECGCNKVALGHHRDDALETLLLCLLHEGRIHTFHPKS